MVKNSASKFSVINSNIKIINEKKSIFIHKTINLNVDFKISTKIIKNWVDTYYEMFRRSDINVPTIKESHCKKNIIIYKLEYLGLNLMQYFESLNSLYNDQDTLLKVFNIIGLATKNNFYMDPHPKNFTILDKNISFVDFTPPYGIDDYRKARLNLEKDKKDKKIISENFTVFHPKNLFYHFIGDLTNISNNNKIIRKIYQLLLKHNFVDLPIDKGIEKSVNIRKIEDYRISKNIFLM